MKSSDVLIPKVIFNLLGDVLNANLVPSIREGQGGPSHSVWVLSFQIADAQNNLHRFEVKLTSSYQQFLDLRPKGLGFDGLTQFERMDAVIKAARENIAAHSKNAASVFGKAGGSAKTLAKAAAARANGAKGGRPRKEQKKGA